MMQDWYKKAKLGIFFHWGAYSVQGTAESWAFANGIMSYDEYMEQLKGFTASEFDAKRWTEMIKRSGAKYAVLTAKHSDGVCLFDTKYTDLSVVKRSPAGRDLIAEYCDAMHDAGLYTGVYFSNTDWSDLDHMEILTGLTRDELIELRGQKAEYSAMWPPQTKAEKTASAEPESREKQEAWNRFLERYRGEIEELVTNYGRIDLFWTDAMLYRRGYSWEVDKAHEIIMKHQPQAVINGRLDGYGDFLTAEQRLPLKPISDDVWEYVHTFNESWGFNPNDKNFKTVKQVVRLFTEAITMGANMLLGIGPYENGKLPPEAESMMEQLGDWIGKYSEAVYETERGLAPNYFRGGSTISYDKKTLYLFVYDRPELIMINGIRNKINRVTSLASGRELKYSITGGAPWANIPGCKWIELDETDIDEICTVLKLELDGELDLWQIEDHGHFGAQDK